MGGGQRFACRKNDQLDIVKHLEHSIRIRLGGFVCLCA